MFQISRCTDRPARVFARDTAEDQANREDNGSALSRATQGMVRATPCVMTILGERGYLTGDEQDNWENERKDCSMR